MATSTTHPPTTAEQGQAPPDIETMRETTRRVLGPDDAPDLLPPAAEVDTLAAALRGHLELLIPEVAETAGPRPYSVQTYCALACVGEARRKLSVAPGPTLEARVVHARKLARVLDSLCDHHERLGETAS
ncbi:DUF6415 family natural product biosynthesis protein [Streptomyces sp. UG1]|uniref:DUF6415 family natural product biosynthesis protein n=1 Tax=Streptomyces sp. UG1 TaxID=3417652 RepID=UPI003CEE5C49